jgi:hypothetical protein
MHVSPNVTANHPQFVIALNIIEDFLEGEQFKYLRLVFDLHIYPAYSNRIFGRMETRNKLKGKRAWTNSIGPALIFLSISSQLVLEVLA